MREKINELIRVMPWRPTTKKGYRYDLERFWRWLQDRGIRWEAVTEDHVFDYLDDHPDWRPSTAHNAVAAIRAFYRFHLGKANSPAERVSIPRPDVGPQRTLDRDEVMQVMASFDTSRLIDIRNLAMFVTALDTKMRASEMCRLVIPELDLERRQARVEVKGGRIARKLFGAYTASCLEGWLAVRMASSTVETVFVAIGGPQPGTPFSTESLRTVFYSMAEKAGVKHFSPHAMRRTGATELLRNGASTRGAQLWGDWQTLDMPERYSRVLEKDYVRDQLPVDIIMGLE